MSINITAFQDLEKQGLLTCYYTATTFCLCRVADWSIMAIFTVPETKTDEDGDPVCTTYYAWHVDQEFASKIMENNKLFAATLLSKQTARDPDLTLDTKEAKYLLTTIREEVKNGTRPCLIDSEFEDMLKALYFKSIEPMIELYGNPPVLSEKKWWQIMVAFFLYPLGLPWFLAGDRKGGILQLIFLVPGCIFLPLLALSVIHTFVFYFRLFCGKIKDEKGLTVMTEDSKQHIRNTIQSYNDYQKELKGY